MLYGYYHFLLAYFGFVFIRSAKKWDVTQYEAVLPQSPTAGNTFNRPNFCVLIFFTRAFKCLVLFLNLRSIVETTFISKPELNESKKENKND